MLRRVFNSLVEGALQQSQVNEAIIYPNPFTRHETQHFGWLTSMAPCFPISSNKISILTTPQQFYETLKHRCAVAKDRIYLSSLYFGSGKLEKDLVQALLDNNEFTNTRRLKINILLDYMRASRFNVDNSRTTLLPLLQHGHRNNCQISLYHTPVLRNLWKKVLPHKFNEVAGVQHMKIYIFDDTLVISGANLSHDYFTNRQDRYFIIEDKRLCDFYCGLVRRVQQFSLSLDEFNNVKQVDEWTLPYEGDKDEWITRAGDLVEDYIERVKNERNLHKEEGHDTWIFPLVQMGQLNINQDAEVTNKILTNLPGDSQLLMATGYFNLTEQYRRALIYDTGARCSILMAHPQTNGFMGAKFPSGGVPYAYSLIAKQFKDEVNRNRQQDRIGLLEYLRPYVTYHGKGVWYYPPGAKSPCLTLVGSPNFGERSVHRDLETQVAVVTENEGLRKQLHEECKGLYKWGVEAETERSVPKWVGALVFLLRNYF